MDAEMQQWLISAETDFSVARHLFDTYYPKPIEIICCHCQQSAEKAIKAVILSGGTDFAVGKRNRIKTG